MYKFSDAEIDDMIRLHSDGALNREIAEKYHVSASTINRVLQNAGVESRHPSLSEERKDMICEAYQKLQKINAVKKQCHVNGDTVRKILDERNIPQLNASDVKKKYHINQNYFDHIDTAEKAYFLGLFYADGTVSKKRNTVSLSLQEADVHILESLKTALESEHPIYKVSLHSKNPKWSDVYMFSISNIHLHEALIKHGVVPNKSYHLSYPVFLTDNLHRHFIRGYLDGDGTITKTNRRVSLIGTEEFCHGLLNVVNRLLNINGNITLCHNDGTVSTCALCFSKVNDACKLLDWIYADTDLFLYRKYKIYKEKYAGYINRAI